MEIIGRKYEVEILKQILGSGKPEFLALYGRRRIGKTFLIKNFFNEAENIAFFSTTGLKDGTLQDQISNFTKQIGDIFYNGLTIQGSKNWNDTFNILNQAISKQNQKVV